VNFGRGENFVADGGFDADRGQAPAGIRLEPELSLVAAAAFVLRLR
jgi:hypothetical protein